MGTQKKGKSSLVKRARRLQAADVKTTLSRILRTDATDDASLASGSTFGGSSGFLSSVRVASTSSKKSKKKQFLIGENSADSVSKPDDSAQPQQDGQGLRLIHKAIQTQNYKRTLDHQDRSDYEYRLRRIATNGVVRLFNSLKAAQKAGDDEMRVSEQTVTIDKAQEKKLVASRDAFLASLRASTGPSY